nr:hypothetical protein [Tanacetum cinerariifolium]
MNTLSKVCEYLKNLEDFLDDGDSLEARKIKEDGERSSCGDLWFTFLVDFVIIGYANEGETLAIFRRDFFVTTKSKVDFCEREIRINLTMIEEEMDIDALLVELVENMEEVRSLNGELVKMGKASRNKGHNVNKLTPPPPSKIEEIPPLQSIAPQPVYHPLSQKQKEKVNEALDKEYKQLEESKPILEVTSGVVIDMGRSIISIDDRVIGHTYFLKPRAKAYIETFKIDEEDDWLSCFKVGRDEDGNHNFDETLKELMKMEYLHDDRDVFVDYSWERDLSIEEDVYPEWCLEFFSKMYFERGVDRTMLMMENVFGLGYVDDSMCLLYRSLRLIVGALVHMLGSKERCQKRELWMMNALEELRGINLAWVIAEHLCRHASRLKENSLICGVIIEYLVKINKKTRTLELKQRHLNITLLTSYRLIVGALVHMLGSKERCQKGELWMMNALEELRGINLAWVIAEHLCRHASRLKENSLICGELMKMEYLHDDRDVFVDYSWERALSIEEDVYPEWCLEFFSKMYFERGVDRTMLMMENVFGLGYVDDSMCLLYRSLRLIVGALVHMLGSKERCQKRELWMMNALEELRGINLAWVIAEHLCRHASRLKENSLICGGLRKKYRLSLKNDVTPRD